MKLIECIKLRVIDYLVVTLEVMIQTDQIIDSLIR